MNSTIDHAAHVPGITPETPLRKIEYVGVIGAGTMGAGIAMNFLNVNLPVQLLETSQAALDRGVATIRKNYESALQRGKITQEQFAARMALLHPTLSYADLKPCDLIIEAVFENMEVKHQV